MWLAGIVFATVCTTGQAGDGFVRRDGAKLTLDGREYRAIGMNSPDLFASYAGIFYHLRECFGTEETARRHMVTAVEEAEKHQIAFLRFYASGFWPKDMKLYFDAPDKYWARMDELMALCRKHHVRLIPSIFFHIYLWPLICGEDYQAIADPKSKTYRAMHGYATELVSRYKHDTNILAWELSNTKPTLRDDREAEYIRAAIDVIETEGASLTAIWAWYLPFDPIYDAENHPALLRRVAEFNAKYSVR